MPSNQKRSNSEKSSKMLAHMSLSRLEELVLPGDWIKSVRIGCVVKVERLRKVHFSELIEAWV